MNKSGIYHINLFIFWRSIILFVLFASFTFPILLHILGPMFLDIIVLSAAWGVLGIAIGNFWHAFKFGLSKRILRVSIFCLVYSAFINLLFIPNAIGYYNAVNNIKRLNNNDIIELTVNNHRRKTIISKTEIDKFVKIAKTAEIYYVSHETPIKEFNLSIIKKDGKISFPATILKSSPNDLVISVKPYLFWNDIIIPQGAIWLRNLKQKKAMAPCE